MADIGAKQAQKMAGGNISTLLPQDRTTEQERLHRKQNPACSASSDSTKVSPGTSPREILSSPTTSG